MWYTQETNNPQFTRRGFDKPTPAPIFPCQESPLPLFFFSAHQPCTNTPPSCTKTVKAVLSQTGVLQTINHPTIGDPPWLWKPLWKIWVRQLGWLFPIWWESHRIHAPNHQPETPILWMVAKSCITKRMAETHPKSWDVYHLSTGDLDFATIHRMLVKPVIISHLYVGIIINNRDLYVNPPSVGEIRTFLTHSSPCTDLPHAPGIPPLHGSSPPASAPMGHAEQCHGYFTGRNGDLTKNRDLTMKHIYFTMNTGDWNMKTSVFHHEISWIMKIWHDLAMTWSWN